MNKLNFAAIAVTFVLIAATGCVEEAQTGEEALMVEQALERSRPIPVRRPALLRPSEIDREARRARHLRPSRPVNPDRAGAELGDIDIAVNDVFISRARGRGTYNVTASVEALNYSRMENLMAAFTLTQGRSVLAAARVHIEQGRTPNTYRVQFRDVQLDRGDYAILADPSNLIDETNERNNGLRFVFPSR
jgi:hypothetical protein